MNNIFIKLGQLNEPLRGRMNLDIIRTSFNCIIRQLKFVSKGQLLQYILLTQNIFPKQKENYHER